QLDSGRQAAAGAGCAAGLSGLLASGTVERRAPRLDDTPDGAGAARRGAGFPLPIVDREPMLEGPHLAVRGAEIAQRRAPRLDGFGEHDAHRVREPLEPPARRTGP